MIIDPQFSHTFGAGTLAWRQRIVAALRRRQGEKVHDHRRQLAEPAGGLTPHGADPAPEGPATFPTGWFTSRDRAYQWLAS
jgi:hypothetical protein